MNQPPACEPHLHPSPPGPQANQIPWWLLPVSIGLLLAVLAFFEFTSMDVALQDQFYNADTGNWLVDRNAALPRWLFYQGPKLAIIALGVTCIASLVLSLWVKPLRRWRYRAMLMGLSVIIVPLILSGARNYTNIYCPSQLQRYGGDKPYRRLTDCCSNKYADLSPGKCFPAGHASGGFALMMAAFCFADRRRRRLALATALAIGWIMGGYQMLKGAHFLGHTVTTMVGAWVLILLIVIIVNRLDWGDRPL